MVSVYTDFKTLLTPKPWREKLFDEISSFASSYGIIRLSALCEHIKLFQDLVPEKFSLESKLSAELSSAMQFLLKTASENSLESTLNADVLFKVENVLIPAHKVKKIKQNFIFNFFFAVNFRCSF
jgi:hypothetical protein